MYTLSYSFIPDILCLQYIRLSVLLGCLIKLVGIIIDAILNLLGKSGIEPVTFEITSV